MRIAAIPAELAPFIGMATLWVRWSLVGESGGGCVALLLGPQKLKTPVKTGVNGGPDVRSTLYFPVF